MRSHVEIDAGVCGFRTRAEVLCEDEQNVSSFAVTSDCEKIRSLAAEIASLTPLDAYQEISSEGESRLLACCRGTLKGCCAACAVPAGLFKAMQVAAGLALPRDVGIRLRKDEVA